MNKSIENLPTVGTCNICMDKQNGHIKVNTKFLVEFDGLAK